MARSLSVDKATIKSQVLFQCLMLCDIKNDTGEWFGSLLPTSSPFYLVCKRKGFFGGGNIFSSDETTESPLRNLVTAASTSSGSPCSAGTSSGNGKAFVSAFSVPS